MRRCVEEVKIGFGRLTPTATIAVIIAAVMIWPLVAKAGELVAGRYLPGDGQEIKLELEIGSPPPPLVIVVQNLPKGIKVVGSSPELIRYDPDEGVAKWLLHKVNPGKMVITLRLDRPVEKGKIRGELRWRNPAGMMVNIELGR